MTYITKKMFFCPVFHTSHFIKLIFETSIYEKFMINLVFSSFLKIGNNKSVAACENFA